MQENRNHSELVTAEHFWNGGESEQAGRIIFESLSAADQPIWAISILKLAIARVNIESPPIHNLLRIADDATQWPQTHDAFSMLRDEVLFLEKPRALSDKDERVLQLYLAENVAKVIYNATKPTDEFDEDAGWWIARCLRDLVDFLQDEQFTRDAWSILARPIRGR